MSELDQSKGLPSDLDLRREALQYAIAACNTAHAGQLGTNEWEIDVTDLAFSFHKFLLGRYSPTNEHTVSVNENVIHVDFNKGDRDGSPDV